MLPTLLLYCSGVYFISAASPSQEPKNIHNQAVAIQTSNSRNYSLTSYFSKDENSIRVPEIKYDDPNKKKTKKFPKRTIQKIIKRKRKQKRRMVKATRQTTKVTEQVKEDPNFQEEDEPTTTPNRPNKQRKKPARNNRNKLATIYPMKSRRKQRNINIRTYKRKGDDKKKEKNKKRPRRELGRKLFILQNLDDIELYGSNPNEVKVKTHVKKYW